MNLIKPLKINTFHKFIQRLAPLEFGLGAFVLRLYHLDTKSIWMDEAFTAYHSTFSALELWTQPISNKPPLYYLITAFFWSPGSDEFALRFSSAFLGALSVSLSWVFARQIASTQFAHLLAFLVLLSDINFHYSQEARQYMLLSVGWLLFLIALLRLITKNSHDTRASKLDLLLLGLGALLMVQTSLLGFPYLLASILVYMSTLRPKHKYLKSFIFYPALAIALATASILPWIPIGLSNAAETFNWLRQPKPLQAIFEFMSLFGGKNLVHLGGKGLAIGIGFLLVLTSLTGMALYTRRKNHRLGVFLIGLLLLPPLLIWLTGLIHPIYLLRTIMPIHLIAFTGLALAIYTLRSRKWRTLVLIVLTCILTISSASYFLFYDKEEWRHLVRELELQMQPQDAVLICERYLYWPMWFYLNQHMPPVLYLNPTRRQLMIKSSLKHTWEPYLQIPARVPPATVWEVGRFRYCISDTHPALPAFTSHHYLSDTGWTGRARALTLIPYRLVNDR